MLALSNYRRKLFDLQTFQNQAHIISVTGIIIYFLGTYYLYTLRAGVRLRGALRAVQHLIAGGEEEAGLGKGETRCRKVRKA